MECLAKTTIDFLIDTDKPQPQLAPPSIQRSLSNIDAANFPLGCGPPKSIESASEPSTQNPNSVDSGLGNNGGGNGETAASSSGMMVGSQPPPVAAVGSVSSSNVVAPLISPSNSNETPPLLQPTSADNANPIDMEDVPPNSVAAPSVGLVNNLPIDDHQAFGLLLFFSLVSWFLDK